MPILKSKRAAGGKVKSRRAGKPSLPAVRVAAPSALRGDVHHVILWSNGLVTMHDSGGEEVGRFDHSDAPARARIVAHAQAACRFTRQRWGNAAKGAKDITREQFAKGL